VNILEEQLKKLEDLDEYLKTHEWFLRDEDGLIFRGVPIKTCMFVPEILQDQVLCYMHGSSVSGHYEVAKTSRRIGSRFW
jgi:hypothetical protein